MSYGEDLRFGLAIQNSFDTSNTNSLFWIPLLSENVSLAKEPLIKQSLRNVYDDGEVYEGMNMIEGDIEFECHPILLGAVLKGALGDPTTSAVGSVFSHLFTPNQADFDSFAANYPLTLIKDLGDGGSSQLMYNMVITNLELGITAGELVKAKASVIGGRWQQIELPAVSYLDEVDWTWDQTSLQLGGAVCAGVKNMTVKIENPMENHHTLCAGHKYPSFTKRSGFRQITAEGSILFNDQTEFQKFIAQSNEELIMTFTGITEVGSGYYDQLELKLPKFRHNEFKPEAGGPGQIETPINAKGVYSVSSATAARVTLINTQTAY